jgi:hypothetical protein
VHNTPSAELREQLEVLAKDCEIAAVKIGMLGNRGNAGSRRRIPGCAQVRACGARSGDEIVERNGIAGCRRSEVPSQRTAEAVGRDYARIFRNPKPLRGWRSRMWPGWKPRRASWWRWERAR